VQDDKSSTSGNGSGASANIKASTGAQPPPPPSTSSSSTEAEQMGDVLLDIVEESCLIPFLEGHLKVGTKAMIGV
jgi:hypothetical protein